MAAGRSTAPARRWSGWTGTPASRSAGHLVLPVVGVVLVMVVGGVRGWAAVTWLAVLTIVLHGYPVLLQRAMRHRVERLRRRLSVAAGSTSPGTVRGGSGSRND